MYRVCIAEDEEYVLKSICKRVENAKMDLHIVGTAENGLEAMELFDSLKPDIFILDINMPKCSGLDFAARVKKMYPDCVTQFIIVTGYDDFDYMRQAIHIGVADYIMKPIFQDEFIGILQQVCERLSKAKKKQVREIILSAESIESYLKKNPFLTGTVLLMYERDILDKIENITDQTGRLLSDIFPLSDWVYIRFHESRNLIFLHSRNKKFDWSLMNQVWTSLIPNVQLQIIYRQCSDEKGDIVIKDLQDTLNDRFWSGNREKLKSAERFSGEHDITFSVLSKALENVRENTWKQILEGMVRNLFSTIENKGKVRIFCYALLLMIANKYREHAEAVPDKLQNMLYPGLEEAFENIQELMLVMEENLSKLYKIIAEEEEKKEIIERIVKYIEQNYMEDLCLNDIASVFYQSPNYLAIKFKESKHVTPMKYLENCRLEKAMDLLENSKLSISHISAAVGYNDANYFARSFKKKYGISPRNFRKEKSC